MLPSFLTTFLFSCSILFASRSARVVGGMQANVARLMLAMACLAIWAHGWGAGVSGAAFPWFLLSGAVGFGLGDMSMFCALPRIGPRLTILITQCLGAPIAGFAEYLVLGTVPTPGQMLCAGAILVGVGIAMAPDTHEPVEPPRFRWGLFFGLGSAMGQGLGAVISRKANEVAQWHGQSIDGASAAYQRILAGVAVTLLGWWLVRVFGGEQENTARRDVWRRAAPLIAANALSGPILGVACFQWALMSSPSVVVLPIVSMSPLVTMGLSWFVEGKPPRKRACAGGIVAVAGASALAWLRAMGF